VDKKYDEFKDYAIVNKNELKKFINCYAIINSWTPFEYSLPSPLMQAVLNEQQEIVEFILYHFHTEICIHANYNCMISEALIRKHEQIALLLARHHSFDMKILTRRIYYIFYSECISIESLGKIIANVPPLLEPFRGEFPPETHRMGSPERLLIERYSQNPDHVYKELRIQYYGTQDASHVFILILFVESNFLFVGK